LALRELYELEEAVKAALQLVKMEETLIIVTADHSHSFTLNGYPQRGNDIFGFGNQTNKQVPYETLSYANGPGFFYHRRNDSKNVNETWRNVIEDPTRGDPFYMHFAGFYQKDETHGGEDVGVYAAGKQSSPKKNAHEICQLFIPCCYFSPISSISPNRHLRDVRRGFATCSVLISHEEFKVYKCRWNSDRFFMIIISTVSRGA